MKILIGMLLKGLVYVSIPVFFILLIASVPAMVAALRSESDFGSCTPIQMYSSWIRHVLG